MSFFNKFSFMSKPARYCSVGYLFSAVSYCSYLTYNDSLNYLKEFRKLDLINFMKVTNIVQTKEPIMNLKFVKMELIEILQETFVVLLYGLSL